MTDKHMIRDVLLRLAEVATTPEIGYRIVSSSVTFTKIIYSNPDFPFYYRTDTLAPSEYFSMSRAVSVNTLFDELFANVSKQFGLTPEQHRTVYKVIKDAIDRHSNGWEFSVREVSEFGGNYKNKRFAAWCRKAATNITYTIKINA